MKIVHVASEMFPYAKTGGLADVIGALTGSLADRGHDIQVFLPGYRRVFERPEAAAAERKTRLKIESGDQFLSGEVRSFSPRPNLTVHLVCREEYFDRSHPYGTGERDYEDNAERFIFFCQAAVETLRLSDVPADIVHGHDWQGALLPVLVRESERRNGVTLAAKTVFTIHNISYQGIFPSTLFGRLNLPDELNSIDGLEYYGQINLMKSGILFADRVTTVSPRYAKEIQTEEFGCGLEGVAQTRADDLTGILNGVDTVAWNPTIDPLLPARYSRADLSGKAACRAELLARCGHDPKFAGPIFGVVCRLVEQKGIDVLLANGDFFGAKGAKLLVLGAGEKRYEEALRALAAQSPASVTLVAGLDETLSHLVEAGSDFFIMPSRFEPCGLNQMYSQLYGSVPVVSRVGGLIDTVTDIDEDPGRGTGIMCAPTEDGLREGLGRAIRLFANKRRYAAVQQRGMARDFSWNNSAVAYERLYQESL